MTPRQKKHVPTCVHPFKIKFHPHVKAKMPGSMGERMVSAHCPDCGAIEHYPEAQEFPRVVWLSPKQMRETLATLESI